MKKTTILLVLLFSGMGLLAQDYTFQTFKMTRVINSHSTETLPKRVLDVRIGHRFGDIAGDAGGWETFFGIENASDILTGFEYGVTDNLTLGINRTKGAGPLKQLINGSVKYRLLRQTDGGGMPISLAVLGNTSISTMKASTEPNLLTSFEKFSHRTSHVAQVIIARKFSDRFSLQLTPSYSHRNLVAFNDQNDIISLGVASRIQLSKVYGLILDVTYPFSTLRTSENGYYPAFGVGLEIDTGGHIFQINLTNATGLIENDYIPYTQSKWSEGQFRLGFTISRWFRM